MPDPAQRDRLPVRVPLVDEVWGIWKSWSMARTNVLGIIPDVATSHPIVSGKTGKRWHMVKDPATLRRPLATHSLSRRAHIGAGNDAPQRPCFRTATC